jgi:hypothetical protein
MSAPLLPRRSGPVLFAWGPVDWTDLKSSVTYHLIYHRSLSLHVNHLVFLNSYMFGAFLVLAALHPTVLLGALAVFVVYVGVLTRTARWYICASCAVLPLATASLVLISTASCRHDYSSALCFAGPSWSFALLLDPSSYTGYPPVLSSLVAGLLVVLASFAFQLLGHRLLESLVSPPIVFHGMVSALPLEIVSLFLRARVPVAPSIDGPLLWCYVDNVRAESLSGTHSSALTPATEKPPVK